MNTAEKRALKSYGKINKFDSDLSSKNEDADNYAKFLNLLEVCKVGKPTCPPPYKFVPLWNSNFAPFRRITFKLSKLVCKCPGSLCSVVDLISANDLHQNLKNHGRVSYCNVKWGLMKILF